MAWNIYISHIPLPVEYCADCGYNILVHVLLCRREIRRQGKLCDVTIKVDDQSFSAHRIVLAATIPYFYAMFMNEMREHREKEITMKEIEAQ